MTFPSIEYLVASGVEVHFLTKKAYAPLIQNHGFATQVHVIPDHASLTQLFEVIRSLKDIGFQEVYDLHRNLRALIVDLFLGQRFRRVRKFRFKEWMLFVFRRRIFLKLGLRPIDRPLEALHAVGTSNYNFSRQFKSLPSQAESQTHDWIASNPNGYVCICAESAWKQKEWPLERFIAVAHELKSLGFGVAWVGLEALPHEALFEGTKDFCGRLNISEVTGLLRQARLLVTNDSGLMHLSEAAGVPVVALFGPTSRELGFAPKMPRSRIVEKDLWCRPCSKTGRLCIRVVDRWKCLTDISVQETMAAIKDVTNIENLDL